jgi:hypothetical protein
VSVYPRGQAEGLGPLLDELEGIKRRLREMEAASGTQSVGLTAQVRSQLTSLGVRVTSLEGRMTTAEADINSLETRVTDLETP